MTNKKILTQTRKAYKDGKRLVAPLVGFPGVKLCDSKIKLAQQNSDEHKKAVMANFEKFKPDAIFPLMDLSVEVNAIGRELLFPENDSATVVKNSFQKETLEKLKNINVEFDSRLLSYVDTVKSLRSELPKETVVGAYVTGPYTFAGLVLGADEAAMSTIIDQTLLHELCGIASEIIIKYSKMLITAGADMICILEPSAVMLSPDQFEEFSSNYVKKIIESVNNKNVDFIYHVCGNAMHIINKMCESGVDALSLDSKETGVDLVKVANQISNDVVIIGNINPTGKILNGSISQVEEETTNLLEIMNEFPNFVLSTGCDLPLDTPVENIEKFMNVGRRYTIR